MIDIFWLLGSLFGWAVSTVIVIWTHRNQCRKAQKYHDDTVQTLGDSAVRAVVAALLEVSRSPQGRGRDKKRWLAGIACRTIGIRKGEHPEDWATMQATFLAGTSKRRMKVSRERR